MAGTKQTDKSSDTNPLVDLSELQDLSFGPDWTSGKSITTSTREPREGGKRGGDRRDRRPSGRDGGKAPERRDRRPARPPRQEGEEGRPEQRERGPRRDRRPPPEREEYQPVLEVLFYPEDIPFKALIHAIKASCRTYELFELARLILSKPERFVIVMKPLAGLPGSIERFVISVPDGLPLESEEAAVSHVLSKHQDKFFTLEEAEIDPPKGSFQMINRCGVTGELLGPPNYHRYQALLADHHTARLPNMSFERFTQKIEAVKEQEVIDEWLKKMSRVVRYKIVSPREGEPEYLDGIEAARHFLLTKRRSEVIRESDQVRLAGKAIEQLSDGPIAKSIRAIHDKQLRFPLDTANNLRGRLRRMNFTIYKRGAKGVSFVCAVKRAFRDSRTVFSESLQELIHFIENHQNIKVTELPESYLGITLEKTTEAPPPPEKAPAIEKVPEEEAAKIVEAHEKSRLGEQEEAPTSEAAPAETPAAETPAKAEPAPPAEPVVAEATPEQKQISQLFADLRWLVTEGYVTEFGDGRLFANPPAPEPKPREEKPAESAAAVEPAPPAVTETTATEQENLPAETPAAEPAAEIAPAPVEEAKPVSSESSVEAFEEKPAPVSAPVAEEPAQEPPEEVAPEPVAEAVPETKAEAPAETDESEPKQA